MRQTSDVKRRTFIKQSLAAFTATIIPSGLVRAGARRLPSDRITCGFIGLGGHGRAANLTNFMGQDDTQVVGLCDVDSENLKLGEKMAADYYTDHKRGSFEGFVKSKDFRELVVRDDLDVIVVSTPDHWHVLASLWALRNGKDVYCEKPLSLTVHEGRVLADTVASYNRVFQTGSEFRGAYNFHRAAELVRNGYIGDVKVIIVYLPRQPDFPGDPTPQPVPQGFDYDMWLGPAPQAPYTKDRVHFNYRWILDYSVGMLADWGAHLLDQAQWVLDREYSGPVRVKADGTFLTEGLFDTAVDFDIEYTYENGIKLYCTDKNRRLEGGIRYVGTDGTITCKYSGYKGRDITADPPDILKNIIKPEGTHLYTCQEGPERNFLDCVKNRQESYYPAEVGHRTATICHIGHIAMLLGEELQWDPVMEKFSNNDRANRYLSRDMRSPWRL